MLEILVKPILEKYHTKTTITLQNIILPNLHISTVEELFLRLNSNSLLNYKQNIVELKKGGIIRFDTYFNAFSVQKWKDYTNIKSISIKLYLKGIFQVKLLTKKYFSGSASLVNQKFINADTLCEVNVFENIDIHSYNGLLYLEIKALGNNCLFKDGYFYTNINSFQNSDVKIAVVMCRCIGI